MEIKLTSEQKREMIADIRHKINKINDLLQEVDNCNYTLMINDMLLQTSTFGNGETYLEKTENILLTYRELEDGVKKAKSDANILRAYLLWSMDEVENAMAVMGEDE